MKKALKVFGGSHSGKSKSPGRLSIAESSNSLNSGKSSNNSRPSSNTSNHFGEEEEEIVTIEEVLSPTTTMTPSSATTTTTKTICLSGGSSSKIMSSNAETKRSRFVHHFASSGHSVSVDDVSVGTNNSRVVVTSIESEDGQTGIVVEPDDELTVVVSPSSPRSSTAHRLQMDTRNEHHVNRVTSDDMEAEGTTSVSAIKARLEAENMKASKSAIRQVDREVVRSGETMRTGTSVHQGSSSKIMTPEMQAEKTSFQTKKREEIVSPGVRYEKNVSSSSSSRFFRTSTKKQQQSSSTVHTSMSQTITSHGSLSNLLVEGFDGTPLPISCSSSGVIKNSLGNFGSILSISSGGREGFKYTDDVSDHKALEAEYTKAEKKLTTLIEKLKKGPRQEVVNVLPTIKDTLKKAWFLLGTELSCKLCDKFRTSGGLDVILDNIKTSSIGTNETENGHEEVSEKSSEEDEELIKLSASVLQYSLSPPNVAYALASSDSQKIVDVANSIQNSSSTTSFIRAGIGIIAHLFISSEETCKELVKRGCLDTVISCVRSIDIETQRNCALAIANLAVFGGPDVQSTMVKAKVPDWLLILLTSLDDFVKFNACHAIAALANNKELEVTVSKSDTFPLLEHFVETHSPSEMSMSPLAKYYGQLREFLKRSLSLLDSDKEEVKALGAFHFALTSLIKKRQGDMSILQKDLNVVPLLSRVASSPHALASKFAGQALKVLGLEVPHKLSQQVPCWSVEDVKEWVKQIGFEAFVPGFISSRVDGDLLLHLDEEMLKDDIGVKNGILRRRFLREVGHLKRLTDYSSVDPTHLTSILEELGPQFLEYAYNLLSCGVDRESLKDLSEDFLRNECSIENGLHRLKILSAVREVQETKEREMREASTDGKSLDIFVSYRRSNGSQLASLLKVLLQMRGFSTFIDIERLEAGKFDCSLVNSIRQAKHFILVLTPQALDRCVGDDECKDWVHREIVEALRCGCNIIPVVENFDWPDESHLPEDMRAVCRFNSIRWIHEYQDACVDKLDRFLRGITTDLDSSAGNALTNRSYYHPTPPPVSSLMSPPSTGSTVSLTRK